MAARPPPDPASACLDRVAAIAGARLGQRVTRLPPRDSALGWKAASIHPLQALETEYQGIVRDAVRGIGDFDLRRADEAKALGNFCFFDASAPRLLGVGPGEPYAGIPFPLIEERLREARAQLKAAARLLARAAPHQPLDLASVRKHLQSARDGAFAVRAPFLAQPCSDHWGVAPIDEASRQIDGLNAAIKAARTPAEFQAIRARIAKALDALDIAVAGISSVQMFYVIEGFYLFRLLFRFRLESGRLLSPDAIAGASGALTDLVTNGHRWLSDWLGEKIVELAARIAAVDPSGNTLFFLKGGRAIQYLQGHRDRGKNDWDTQIVINPELPPAQWYALFLRVSNAVLLALKSFKAELYMLLNHNAGRFNQELDALPAPVAPVDSVDPDDAGEGADPLEPEADPDELDEAAAAAPSHAVYRANCKAELIDVGLPRYDTVEATEQWLQLRNNILVDPDDGMPYPGYLYYISEYILMVREVFAGASPSLRKAPTRIGRLYDMLMLPPVGGVIAHERTLIPAGLMQLSLAAIDQEADPAAQRALIVLLRQFVEAYGLAADAGLAGAFDAYFAANLPDAAALAPYPDALKADIQAQIAADAINPGSLALTDAIGFCQWLSGQMATHFAHRAAFVDGRQERLKRLVRKLGGLFSKREELEVQLAVAQSFAAGQQADYLRFDRPEDLEPVVSLSVGLYSPRPDADPATMIELVAPIVDEYMEEHPDLFLKEPGTPPGVLRLVWADPEALAAFNPAPLEPYAPLAVEIFCRRPARPTLAYVWGQPILGLRDLIRDYRRRAAAIEEFATRLKLRETAAALTDMMTRAANFEPPNPAILALRDGRCRYLMISSPDNAVGRRAIYPKSYPPDTAYQILLPDNHAALGDMLRQASPATLDLLVINQGHGGIGNFAGWSANDLDAYLVQPLRHSGVRARLIILDFCVSASLLGTFAPLCAPGGAIVSSLYSITEVVMTTELWGAIQPALAPHGFNAVEAAIIRRLRTVTRTLTGFSHLDKVRTASEADVAAFLAAHRFPENRDAISIVRYLPPIADALECDSKDRAQAYAALRAVSLSPNLGFAEQAILAMLPASAAQFTGAVRHQILAQLHQRVIAILTEPPYHIEAEVGGRRLFRGEHSLWEMLKQNRSRLLALAPGLLRCPTAFSWFDAASRDLELDSELAGREIDPEVGALLELIAPGAPVDVVQIVSGLLDSQTVSQTRNADDYLQ